MNPSIYIPKIWTLDYVLAFFYIFIIYIVAYAYRSKKMQSDSDYEYFMWALSVKLFGGLGFMLLTVYYWGGGDTYSYFNTARDYLRFSFENPEEGLRVFFASVENMNWYKYKFAYNRHNFLKDPSSFTTVKITAIINLIGFNSYVVSTVIYSALSFLGIWNMYYLFSKIYPHLKKQLFFGVFFIPTVILWGSGILKDTITITCIAWIVYSFINIVILKRKKTLSLIIIISTTLTITYLKPYILYILYPCLFIWIQSNLKELITSSLIRNLIAPFIALVLVVSSYFLAQKLSKNADRYSLEKIEDTMTGFQTWHTTVSKAEHQAAYTLGDNDFSTSGIFKKVPSALAVTFFRPYPWEITNASTLLAAIEGLALLMFSVWLILKYRLRLFQLIFKNNDILFLLLFAILFGVVVGITSYNFGALSRYKIPAQMFYVIALILITDKTNRLPQDN